MDLLILHYLKVQNSSILVVSQKIVAKELWLQKEKFISIIA